MMTLSVTAKTFGIAPALRALSAHRELLWTLTAREILVRYKQAALGVAWAVLQPLALMAVFALFFGRYARIPSGGVPYPVFFLVALVPWQFFSSAIAFAVPSLSGNAHLITKVAFPREVLPLASVLAAGVDFLIGLVLLLAVLLATHVPLSANALFVLPLALVQLLFTTAMALALSAINVRYRDVRYVVPLLLQLWLYASPVIYPTSVVPESLRPYYLLNPMAALIDAYRRCLAHGAPPDTSSLAMASAIAVTLLVAAYAGFKRAERTFADVI
jgi:lipopolysaccharide transport system permease protein